MLISVIRSLITSISSIYILSKILKQKVEFKRLLIGTLLLTLILSFVYDVFPTYFFIQYCILFLSIFLIFPSSISKAILSTIILFILFSISDMMVSIICLTFQLDFKNFSSFSITILNIGICILSILLTHISIIKKFINYVFYHAHVIIYILFTILLFIFLKYFSFPNYLLLIFIFIFLLIGIFFMIKQIVEKERFNNEYDILIKHVEEFEKIIERKRLEVHEYKNHLLVIQAMAEHKNKEIQKLIDEILIQNPVDIEDQTLLAIENIPIKGLKGMIYYKTVHAIEKKVQVEVDISRSLEKKILSKIQERDIQDICKLIGIFMDNAIEAACETKNKQLSISMYTNGNQEFIISIANEFKHLIAINQIQTTKGNGHGYGLKFAKEVVLSNPHIQNTRECISNVFIQNIIFK